MKVPTIEKLSLRFLRIVCAVADRQVSKSGVTLLVDIEFQAIEEPEQRKERDVNVPVQEKLALLILIFCFHRLAHRVALLRVVSLSSFVKRDDLRGLLRLRCVA